MAAEFDSVILKDKVVKGDKLGEIKLMLEGLKNTHTADTAFHNRCIEVWCEMNGRRYAFAYALPEGARIDEASLSITERKKGKLKVFFKKMSDFQLSGSH